jgi:serine/threonine protein phosphatase PrpC
MTQSRDGQPGWSLEEPDAAAAALPRLPLSLSVRDIESPEPPPTALVDSSDRPDQIDDADILGEPTRDGIDEPPAMVPNVAALFEDVKTMELSLVGVPMPISLGPTVAEAAEELAVPPERMPPWLAVEGESGLAALDEATRLDLSDDAPAYLDHDVPTTTPILPAADEKTVDLPALHRRPERPASTDEARTTEGAVLDAPPDATVRPPSVQDSLRADGGEVVLLTEALGEQSGMLFFKATIEGEDGFYTAIWIPHAVPEPPWAHLPDPRLVRPRCRVSSAHWCLRVFERPRGTNLIEYLGDDDKLLPAMATLELGIELAEVLESVHGAGLMLYDLDPSQIVLERGGRIRMHAVAGLPKAGTLPPVAPGIFCAPEVRRRLRYKVNAAADVYAAALLLYALLARRAPLELDTDPSLLCSPRVFRPECPLGVWPHLRACLDANPLRRVGHARGLRDALVKARDRLLSEARATEDAAAVRLNAWAEQHVGYTKARRGSGQQDRSLAVTSTAANCGLYVVADGVSRCKYGDGGFAAEQVEWASLQRWSGLERAGSAALDLSHWQRCDVLKQVSRSAGKRVSTEINARYAPLPNEPNQVMSSTLVSAFIVGGEATIANLGDSRAYLVRDGTIEQISIDHDRCTDALRLGLGFRDAATVSMGAALTRVVGRVIVDADGSTRPDPFDPEMFRVRLLPGDRIVLCSDGVADYVAGAGNSTSEQERKILEVTLQEPDPARAAFELVVLSNRVGGYDNISCVVIAIESTPS